MKITKKLTVYITGFILVLPLFSFIFTPQTALAYKCTGQTGDLQHYYKNGACYQPVGTTCLDNPAPANIADCKNRDTSKDTKVAGELPVKNDGSQITDWQCASGTYNSQKQVCESCTAFGACQTLSNVTPTPKGNDTTVDPNTQNNNGSNSNNSSTTDNSGGKGTCAGEKTDFFACGANGSDAIVAVLKIIILIVSVGVGVVAVGGIVYGAILYASAQDNQEQVQKGIRMIRSVIIGLVLYIFMVSIINFLVPGGVFGSSQTPAATNNTSNSNNSNNNNTSATNSNQTNNTTNNQNQTNTNTNTNKKQSSNPFTP